MRRFVRSSFVAVCLLFLSSSLPADGVHDSNNRAGSFSAILIHFTGTDPASVGGDTAFFMSKTIGSEADHSNWLDDPEDHHGKAWGWHKHHNDDGDQDNGDTDDDSGHTGSTGSGSATLAVPEPSVLVLLSAALAAFLLNSLRRATV